MFDSYSSVSNHVNAVTGSIVKTYKESYFIDLHFNSSLCDRLFKEKANEVVIQMVICGDRRVIAEVINRKDYEKIFNSEVE